MTVEPTNAPVEQTGDDSGAWRRASALFLVVLATSIVQPTALVAVPFLVLVALRGMRGGAVFAACVLATVVVAVGPRDDAWFVERAWAVLVGGLFAGVTLAKPDWRLTSRSLAAVAGSTVVWGGFVALRSGAWQAIDWTISDQLRGGYTTWLDAMTILRQGEPVSPALVSAIYRTVEAQIAVFPALTALESMAALAVAWWLYHRLVFREDRGIDPLRGFRFNDQLVWLMVAGLLLVTLRVGDGFTRLGANLAVFMGALYALRGLGVVVFVSGGPTFFSATMFVLGFVFAAPVVIGFMVLFGIADSWLDLRERVGSSAT